MAALPVSERSQEPCALSTSNDDSTHGASAPATPGPRLRASDGNARQRQYPQSACVSFALALPLRRESYLYGHSIADSSTTRTSQRRPQGQAKTPGKRAQHGNPRRRVAYIQASTGVDDTDDFFLPAVDAATLANNVTIGPGGPTRHDSKGDAQARGRNGHSGHSRRPPSSWRDDLNAQPQTVAEQRKALQQAAMRKTKERREKDADFLQIARDAIAMADIPEDAAGITDVSVSATSVSGNGRELAPRRNPDSPAAQGTEPLAVVRDDGGPEAAKRTSFDEALLSSSDDIEGAKRSSPVARARISQETQSTAGAPVGSASGAKADSQNSPQEEHHHKESAANTTPPEAESASPLSLRVGGLVMHAKHGVGRFRGLERKSEHDGFPQEFVVLEYSDGDVYVTLSQLDSLRSLTNAEAQRITKLDAVSGSTDYSDASSHQQLRARRSRFHAREKARQRIREQLVNLHGLYAARDSVQRTPYKAFPEEESAFASECDFSLTPDQQSAVNEVYRDLSQKTRPMDRLLCGDVGFGKTEVALRAAFRVLMAGRQVAILAPTTILAQQHYDTFKSRFEGTELGRQIACLTRFVKRKNILEARARIESGEARIVVGTHMLLGDSVVFQDLGLFVVDEEHRFGVNQKEKLRCKHREVDTLFLSATPIPRTLHLALSGLRDTSVLKSPPPGRKAVQTKVAVSGPGVVRKAIALELDRDGQVFYVVPRIEGIEAVANWIQDLFPDAKVLVAHGSHKDLEQRIWAFASGRYDILVCTSIIENGINLPRVNTLLVQDAVRFGMAQLHQLRGRVGRCDKQAYTWLLYSKKPTLGSSQATERLYALQRFSGLGAGFAIAQRDMEMRGVGTVLGVEQHGNSALDTKEYSKILIEELESAKTGAEVPLTLPSAVNCEIFLPVATFIPDTYVPELEEKMAIYGKLSRATTMRALATLAQELKDARGPLPMNVQQHIAVLRLKLLSRRLGIRRIILERQHVVLDWPIREASVRRLIAFITDRRTQMRFECIEPDERVVVRGLGLCTGEVQLAKLLTWLGTFAKAAANFKRDSGPPAPGSSIVNTGSQA